MKHDLFVYMLRCADGSYYVGSYRGHDLMWRVGEHNAGKHPTAYTFKRRPVDLVWSDYFTNAFDAIRTERQSKGWSRAKKEALVRGDAAALKALSRRGVRPASILRDASLREAPQDEAGSVSPHPEEQQSDVTKGAAAGILRDAPLRCAPQDEAKPVARPAE